MIMTVFRSRLMPGLQDEYVALVDRMQKIAKTIPGYISHKGFWAEDGERVTIVEFEHEEGQRAWRMHPEHIEAQRQGRRSIIRNTTSRSARLSTPTHSSARRSADARNYLRPRSKALRRSSMARRRDLNRITVWIVM